MTAYEKQLEQEAYFFSLRDQFLQTARERGITMRLLGSIAFRTHCPSFKYLAYPFGRVIRDIDFAAYSKDVKNVRELFLDLGWQENMMVARLFGHQRRIFHHSGKDTHADVFLDRLRFCHDIDLRGRLEIDYPTISLVDLLLEKLQIVQINEKDLLDAAVLIREHDIGDSDDETINSGYLAHLCSKDWGLWRTVTANLGELALFSQEHIGSNQDKHDIGAKIQMLSETIADKKKTFLWKIRAKIGDRIKWYKDVDEASR